MVQIRYCAGEQVYPTAPQPPSVTPPTDVKEHI